MKTTLGFYPTPLVPLKRFSNSLGGAQILMKRDDQTGLAFGGNKTRKLEHFIVDAVKNGADVILTAGAQQSNHCRQTAAACASAGLECHLVLGGTEAEIPNGNLLLDYLLGAKIHLTGPERKGESLTRVATELKNEGRRPYIVPYGGSNAIGARAFVDAVKEIKMQLTETNTEIDRIVFASSSGGTHAGFLVGTKLYDLPVEILGIGIDKGEAGEKPFCEHIAEIANETAGFYNLKQHFTADDVLLRDEYVGAGYGVVGSLEKEAISLLASTEGILLDPVYTGRAMGALIDMTRRGEFKKSETILFWHTGGTPALFSYAVELSKF